MRYAADSIRHTVTVILEEVAALAVSETKKLGSLLASWYWETLFLQAEGPHGSQSG